MKKNISQISTFLLVSTLLFTSCKKPVATFSADKSIVKIGEVVTFTDGSTDAEKGMFIWNFGDGTTSTLKNPTHVYERAGKYTVTQTVATKRGKNPSDFVLTITVDGPIANFTAPDTSVVGEVIIFEDASTDAERYVWDFGDGSTSQAENPSHVYNASGVYTVVLTVYTANNESSSTKSADIIIVGGSGDHATATKIVGKWKYKSMERTETHNGTAYPSGTYTTTFTDIYHEFLATGDIIKTDENNNQTLNGNYSIMDAVRIMYTSKIYTIETLDATTFKITRVETNPNYSTGISFVKQVVTTTYNYSK